MKYCAEKYYILCWKNTKYGAERNMGSESKTNVSEWAGVCGWKLTWRYPLHLHQSPAPLLLPPPPPLHPSCISSGTQTCWGARSAGSPGGPPQGPTAARSLYREHLSSNTSVFTTYRATQVWITQHLTWEVHDDPAALLELHQLLTTFICCLKVLAGAPEQLRKNLSDHLYASVVICKNRWIARISHRWIHILHVNLSNLFHLNLLPACVNV